MNVYLDTNIFAYIENGSLSLSDLKLILPEKTEKIFYSSSHIHECLEIRGIDEKQKNERINKRLTTISQITQDNYLFENLNNEMFKLIESPHTVIETITEVPFAQNMIKSMSNSISEEQKEAIREELELDPKRLNNYKPSEIVDFLTRKTNQFGNNYSFLNFIEKSLSFHPNASSFGLGNRITAIFELLDMLGYWKDHYTTKSNYARLWDGSHTFFAAHCDVFITDDKKTRHKAKVVYDLYNIGTKVISSKGKE